MFDSAGLASMEDLRAFAVEELGWLKTAGTHPLAAYFQAGVHIDENTAHNRVVDSLNWRMTAMNMPVVIEHHMSGSNRCDFTAAATINGRRCSSYRRKDNGIPSYIRLPLRDLIGSTPAIRRPSSRKSILCPGLVRTRRWQTAFAMGPKPHSNCRTGFSRKYPKIYEGRSMP